MSASARALGTFATNEPLTIMTKTLPATFSPSEPNIRAFSTPGSRPRAVSTGGNGGHVRHHAFHEGRDVRAPNHRWMFG
jgi:hypothetical protein